MCYSGRSQGIVACSALTVMQPASRSKSNEGVVIDPKTTAENRAKGWDLAALPSVGVALLPKLSCPVCWPAYTALLSSVGINFVDYTPYLLPTLTAFLAITLWALAYRARARRGYGPLALGALGSIAVLAGKFLFESDVGLYSGAGLLVGAALWNLWPNSRPQGQCPSTNQGDNHGYQTTD